VDPFTPDERLNGNYYQWGNNVPVNNTNWPTTDPTGTFAYSFYHDSQNNSYHGPLIKGAEDPCPAGWHVPSVKEWIHLITMTMALPEASSTAVGEDIWTVSNINYTNGKKIGDYLYLPAAGKLDATSGNPVDHNFSGMYWISGDPENMLNNIIIPTIGNVFRIRFIQKSLKEIDEDFRTANPDWDWDSPPPYLSDLFQDIPKSTGMPVRCVANFYLPQSEPLN
jgi:uncharacterized protein (TIGR02145 family)